jgi:DinB family protein
VGTPAERQALLEELQVMPEFLTGRFAGLSAEAARRGGLDGTFSPVEQCWHLADLESEGFGERIRLLLREERPFLPDFDGARAARERDYRARSLGEGLQAFRAARESTLALLRSVPDGAWSRVGVQEGVGDVRLSDIPRLMRDHDASHEAEILAWYQANRERGA